MGKGGSHLAALPTYCLQHSAPVAFHGEVIFQVRCDIFKREEVLQTRVQLQHPQHQPHPVESQMRVHLRVRVD